jgi:hypothetical protein
MTQPTYEQKFADLLFLLANSKEQLVMIHHPQVLGDNYEEIVESLNRLSVAGKHLAIVPPKDRD